MERERRERETRCADGLMGTGGWMDWHRTDELRRTRPLGFFPSLCSSVAHGPRSPMLSNAYLIFVCSR